MRKHIDKLASESQPAAPEPTQFHSEMSARPDKMVYRIRRDPGQKGRQATIVRVAGNSWKEDSFFMLDADGVAQEITVLSRYGAGLMQNGEFKTKVIVTDKFKISIRSSRYGTQHDELSITGYGSAQYGSVPKDLIAADPDSLVYQLQDIKEFKPAQPAQ